MKRTINEMKLRLPAVSVNEAVARSVISSFAAELNPTVEELGENIANIIDENKKLPEGTTNAGKQDD